MMWGAIIGAAGSIIGAGIQNKSAKNAVKASQAAAAQERSWAVDDQAEQFVRLRAAAEKAGFNPLTALGAAPNSGMVNPTSASSASAQNYMGEAIATSSLMLADSMSKTNAAATGKKLQNANRANAALSAKLTAATLRPKMAGVFDRPTKFGIGANGKTGQGSASVLGDSSDTARHSADLYQLTPFASVDPIDPRREVEDGAVKSHSGFMVIDNPYFGRLYAPTLDGDEQLHWYDYPDLLPLAAQWAWNRGIPWYSNQMSEAAKRQQEKRAARAARTPNQRYQPSPLAGYDALTGSYPMERVSGK